MVPIKWNDNDLIRELPNSKNWKDLCIKIGISGKSQRNVYRVRNRANDLKLDYSHFSWKRKYTVEQLKYAVQNSFSYRQTLKLLGMCESGSAYIFIKRAIKESELDISHFTGRRSTENKSFPNPVPLNEILVENSTYLNTYCLKNRLIKEGLKEKKCEICGIIKWMGMPVPTELDHINGIRNDNRLFNLRIICRNCGGQLLTFAGRNSKWAGAGIGRQERFKTVCS